MVTLVEFVARDEVKDEATVTSVDEEEVVDVREASEDVRETGEISPSPASWRCGVSASSEDLELSEALDLARGSGRRAYVNAFGSMSIPVDVLEFRGELWTEDRGV